MNLPQGQYRSETVRRYAEQVANRDIYDSLKININIDQILMKRDPRVGEVILELLSRKAHFILYADSEHYAFIMPDRRYVACFAKGEQTTREIMKNEQQFLNRVRIAYAVYDKVLLPEKVLPDMDEQIEISSPLKLIAI